MLMLGNNDWSPGRKPIPYLPWDKFAHAQDEPSFDAFSIDTNFGIYPQKKDLDLSLSSDIVVSYKTENSQLSDDEQE